MLERVALGQTRFLTPGVAPDPRGVVLGRLGVLIFPSLEGVVSWLRVYAADGSLDEFLPGLEIQRLVTPLKSRGMALRIPANSSYVMDKAARLAKLVGGTTFTGTTKHFVAYRDDGSPYGYDTAEINAVPDTVDFICHGKESQHPYKVEGDVSFTKLLFRLSMRRTPGGERLRDEERGELVVLCERGLGNGLVRYLWRNRVEATATLVSSSKKSDFDDAKASDFLVLRVRDLPLRILELFLGTPGLTVFSLLAPNVASQVGYAHPIHLTSCVSVFDSEKLHLFWGERDRVEVLEGAIDGVPIENLTRVDTREGGSLEPIPMICREADPVGVEVNLERSMTAPRHVAAVLIPEEHQAWLKRLVYLLPQTSLRGHRIAITDRGVLVLAEARVDVIPLGLPLVFAADGLLIPLGMDVVPRVAPEVLAAALGHGPGLITILPSAGPPFQIKESELVPLERRVLARLEVERATPLDMTTGARTAPEVVNDPVGRFALWGFSTGEKDAPKALPPKPGEDAG